ncbi:hypothetical protein MTR67_017589 [Solanum verrucosum]|uniref:RING-type E3 ubiquitin transferase n=1 Tax=Solanum verrucosum TaxID=315347 RepID=A0AAF0TLZ2_SOLVR|nr:hypothetical protein MTR67_017589 [Solanum verrucosum]
MLNMLFLVIHTFHEICGNESKQKWSIATENLKSQDDEEDEHGDAQHDDIFYDGEMSYEALLELQEHIGGVEIGLKKSNISKLLKQSKYQSAKMKNYSESCCICLPKKKKKKKKNKKKKKKKKKKRKKEKEKEKDKEKETWVRPRNLHSKQKQSIATENLKSQDDEEDEHGDAQHDDIFYDGEMSYEDTYDDGAELGKINCGHEFHYQCIRRWLKRNNSGPICRRIALTPFDRNLWFSF